LHIDTLNLDAVQAFAVFADCLNFSEAALRLHVSQPALHVKVQKLSQRLACPLYVRQGRVLALTPAGQQVARFGRETRARTLEFCRELSGQENAPPLRLAAGDGAYLYLLGAGIQSYQRKPSNRLHLITANAATALQAVHGGVADVGVAALDGAPSGLASHALCDVALVLAVPAKHPFAGKKALRLSELSDCPLIVPPEGRPHRVMLARMLQSVGLALNVSVEANGWELMLHFVQLGLGAAVVNACCRLPKGVVSIPMPELPSVRYWLFHRADSVTTFRLKPLVDTLISQQDQRWRCAP
jgi:LysR family transcriptional regulator, low CO2-responsive transcriptional regulator